jgi:F-box and WD-40 domain protein CDC4
MKHAREEIPGSEDDDLDTRIDHDMRGLPRHKSRQTISPRREERSVFPVPGSATPPADEEEYEAFGVPETYLEPQGHTVANATDASLPSPSLSPITAAANQNKRPVPPLFHEKGILSPPARLPRSPQTMKSKTTLQAPFADTAPSNAGPRSHTPSFTEIPGMIDSFDAMPEGLKAYVLFQMLRRCTKPTLHLVSDAMAPALKCDFIARLPLELSINVISHLDAQSLCRASQVSQKWRQTIDTDEKLWWNRLTRDGYTIKVDELKKAMDEGWGWQAPDGPNGFEENLAMTRRESDAVSNITMDDSDLTDDVSSPPRKKHKAATKSSTSKQHKSNESIVLKAHKQHSLMSTNPIDWVRLADPTAGPQTIADASKGSIPDPATGLPSIREHHLFKTLYQRHHSIRHSWMDPTTKPRHLAFRAHQRHVVTCLQFDQDKIITGSDDAAIDIYNTKTGESIRRLHGHEGGVWALSYRGNTLVSGSTDRSVRVWDINEGEEMHVFQGHTSTVRCLVVVEPHEVGRTADGKMIMLPRFPLIITGSRDSTCRVWRLPNAHEVRVKQTGPPQNEGENPYYIRTLQGHMHSVRAIAAFCDTLVSGSYDTTVRVWKISTGELVHRLQGHTQKVYSVVLDYERNRCMSGSMDNLVKVWSLESGTCLFNLEGHTSLVGLLDLKDNCLVSAAADSTLRVWDPQTGRCVHDLSAHTGAITCFAHDGDKVISGSDRTLKMWNTKTGECVRDLLTDLNGVWQIGFDERRCVAAVQRSDFTYIEVSLALQFSAYVN